MTRSQSNVVRLKDYLPRPPRRPRQKSQYELYPLPFFNAEKRSTWDVAPTGNYTVDCETGRNYAFEFLRSCDGTCGWVALLGWIVADMIRTGPSGTFPNGDSKINGVVIGFLGAIGEALTLLQMEQPA